MGLHITCSQIIFRGSLDITYIGSYPMWSFGVSEIKQVGKLLLGYISQNKVTRSGK
jgi:hypothetical protein